MSRMDGCIQTPNGLDMMHPSAKSWQINCLAPLWGSHLYSGLLVKKPPSQAGHGLSALEIVIRMEMKS